MNTKLTPATPALAEYKNLKRFHAIPYVQSLHPNPNRTSIHLFVERPGKATLREVSQYEQTRRHASSTSFETIPTLDKHRGQLSKVEVIVRHIQVSSLWMNEELTYEILALAHC